MKIYTKTGDGGDTGLFGGGRIRKNADRIAAYGTVDELNAVLGVARAELARLPMAGDAEGVELDALLDDIQNRLFDLGAELATPSPEERGTALLAEKHVERLERAIDHYEGTLPPLRQFVLPGGSAAAAQLHLARCVCRRAERLVVTLADHEGVRDLALWYVNRLSDLLFVAARVANRRSGVGDTPWSKDANQTAS
ncbi:MAG: cob(I)yrinic acid a,c-diamide adenosyltransferase [Lacipirellulaceae bacterium]